MFREYSVSNELYSATVNKLSAANRKIYRLKKQISQLSGEVIASGEVMQYPSGIEIGDITLSDVNQKIIKRAGKEIKIYIQECKK